MNTIKNSVQLIGNLGADIEIKTFDNGNKVARTVIATNDYYKNNKGEKVKDTQWHTVVAWGNLADNMSGILSKGDEVAIQGKLSHRRYESEGQMKSITEIVVNEFLKISKKND